jgi:flavin reductase (DIM6/NTAB) family NADH-FMN oxidoreductase RutF
VSVANAPDLSSGRLREAFAGFPSGVVAIAASVDGVDEVLVVSSFTVGVSMDPPLVMFAVQHSSTTWPVLRDAAGRGAGAGGAGGSGVRLGVSVLGEGHLDVARQLAGRDRAARLAGLSVTRSVSGAVLLAGAPMHLVCSVYETHRAGDHDIVVLGVEDLALDGSVRPLLWHRSAFTVA